MITAHPNAAEGSVETLSSYSPSDFQPPCVVLCRNTAPLISFAFALLRRKVQCNVRGRDIGARLVALIKRQRASDIPDLVIRLGQWRADQLSRSSNPDSIDDQYQSLLWVIDSVGFDNTISSVESKIKSLFSDEIPGSSVLLSTIHKSKGLEWPTVFLLDVAKLYPNKRATLPWQKEQEKNLMYVACTRSQSKLVYIQSDRWKGESV